MQLVVPLAGRGQRFIDAGYAAPKPLISVDGTPMVVRAIQDLPRCDQAVLIVNSEHVAEHRIDSELARWMPGSRFVVTEGLTAGQACTVRLAAPELNADESVLVAACDNSHLYDARMFYRLVAEGYDCLIWTYRRDPRVLSNPNAYGWVRLKPGSTEFEEVSCKKPISETPLEDHAVSGCFWFRRAQDMVEGIDRLVAGNCRVNNEFYLDVVPNLLRESGYRIGVFEVEKYIGWGTPHDLEDYQRWQRYFWEVDNARAVRSSRRVVGTPRDFQAAA